MSIEKVEWMVWRSLTPSEKDVLYRGGLSDNGDELIAKRLVNSDVVVDMLQKLGKKVDTSKWVLQPQGHVVTLTYGGDTCELPHSTKWTNYYVCMSVTGIDTDFLFDKRVPKSVVLALVQSGEFEALFDLWSRFQQ